MKVHRRLQGGGRQRSTRPLAIEAGGDHRDLHLARQGGVDNRAEDDVRILVGRLLDHAGSFVDLHQREVRTAGHIDDDAPGAVDRAVLEQWTCHCLLRRQHRSVVAFGDTGAHHRDAHPRHDRLHIREIEIDQSRHQNQVRDALDRLPQHVVCERERIGERGAPFDDRQKPLVRDGDDRVDALP
jgi:hypothetical protein